MAQGTHIERIERRAVGGGDQRGLGTGVKGLGAVLLALLMGACSTVTTSPPAPQPPELRFEGGRDFPIFARSIDIVEAYQPPLQAPHVEHEFQVLPAQIIRNWSADRLSPVGQEGRLTITISDGRVVETVLPTNQNVRGVFTNEINREWNAALTAQLFYEGPFGTASSEIRANAVRSLNEGITLNDRAEIYYQMLDDLAKKVDTALSAEFRTGLNMIVIDQGF